MSEPVICKTIGVVTKGGDDGDVEHGTFEVILSTPATDRDGEEVKAEEWKTPLPDHITFDIDHGMSVATTVGSGAPTLDGAGKMIVKGRWASTPLAQQTRALVNEGHIKTTSVAFLRLGTKAAGGAKRELLNGAFVAVPSNTEALILNSKALQRELAEHEATPTQTKAAAEAVLKALAGSYEERERAVYEAIRADFTDHDNDVYAWPVATFDDNVVFRISGGDESGTTWRAPYTMADDGTATLGEREKVVISEVITTVSEGSDTSASKDADPAATAAGSASPDVETRALDADAVAKARAVAQANSNLLAANFGQ
jgi:hypothetical protein